MALEEVDEKHTERKDFSRGRKQNILHIFPEDLQMTLQHEVEGSAGAVMLLFDKQQLPSRSVKDVEQTLLELRSMLANPEDKLLNDLTEIVSSGRV